MIKNSTDSEMLTPIAIGFQLNFNILFYKNKHYMIVQFLTFHWQNRESLQKKKYFEQSISNAKVGIYTCIFFDNIFYQDVGHCTHKMIPTLASKSVWLCG